MFCWISHNVLELFSSYLTLLSSSNKSGDFPRSKKESIEISKLVWTSPTRQSLFGKSLFDLTLLFAIAKSFFCSVWISLMTSLTRKRLPKQGNIRRILSQKNLGIASNLCNWIHLSEYFQACYHMFRGQRNEKKSWKPRATFWVTVWTHHSTIQQTWPQTPVLRDQSGFEWTSINWFTNTCNNYQTSGNLISPHSIYIFLISLFKPEGCTFSLLAVSTPALWLLGWLGG